MESQTGREMPQYQSHKKVWALKIKSVQRLRPTVEELEAILKEEGEWHHVVAAIITPEEEGYAPFEVDDAYVQKHDPQVGGYYVVYADGYKSWSPADAFEEGYTRI